MYDENALSNDIVSTGQQALNAVKSSLSIAQTINNLVGTPNQEVSLLETTKAALSKKIKISNQAGKITITPHGKEFINSSQFKSAAAQDLQNYQSAMMNTQCFALNGTEQDLHYFAHADTLDVKQILKHPDIDTVTKVVENIQKMKDSGLVAIEGATVKATAKGQELILKAAAKGAVKGTVSTGTAAASGAVTGGVGTIVVAVGDAALKVGTKVAEAFTSNGLK